MHVPARKELTWRKFGDDKWTALSDKTLAGDVGQIRGPQGWRVCVGGVTYRIFIWLEHRKAYTPHEALGGLGAALSPLTLRMSRAQVNGDAGKRYGVY
jgi:hypothetical protein